ncbi:hypothetical protein FFF34_000280 [Inquilinus sp. KBS0705]|nr:hypothetical protein FFF34_000280 [Inquilinus sp. KBS0705]
MITAEPFGGLANRMRVIASCIALKQVLKTQLTIVWNENAELNCPYHLLFEDEGIFNIRPKNKLDYHTRSLNHMSGLQKLKTKLVNKITGINYTLNDSDILNLVLPGKLDIHEVVRQNKNVYIQTCQEFGVADMAYKHFKPTSALSKKINDITDAFNPYTIGVHIRRTDNKQAIQNSPISLFIAQMHKELEQQNATKFFLCTDDIAVQDTMKAEFGDKVLIHHKEVIDRNSVKGIQDALIDMYCLAKTSKILGSYWSSFSEVAAKLYNTPLQTIKQLS